MKHHDIQLTGSISITGSLTVPVGTTNERPLNPKSGSIRMNTTTGVLEIYTAVSGAAWESVGEQAAAVAGTDIEYLLIAGGGGSAGTINNGYGTGGGGAGGFISSSITAVESGSTFTVTIGGGGSAGSSTPTNGTTGDDSTIAGATISTITANGGGHSTIQSTATGADGGSGGGASGVNATNVGGSGTVGQGKDGGDTTGGGGYTAGAGGGGAGSAGSNSSGAQTTAASSFGGDGGNGLQSSITGTGVTYAGGGGGGTTYGTTSELPGQGGSGGGGTAGTNGAQGSSGTANTGGGAAGRSTVGSGGVQSGNAGGSGVAIFAYNSGSINCAGGIVGDAGNGRKYHQFNTSGTFYIGSTSDFQFVTDSLVLHLDASNTDSYPGTGTTWYDLSGNGYNLTLQNASTWNAAGYMDFTSTMAKYIDGGVLKDIPNTSGPGTLQVWSKFKSSPSEWRTLIRGAGTGDFVNSQNHQIIVSNQSPYLDIGYYDNNNASGFNDSGFNIDTIPNYLTNFNHLAFQFNNSSPYWSMFYNDNLNTAASTITSANVTADANTGFAGVGGYHSETAVMSTHSQHWGYISVFLYYNKILTEAEMRQNYNAFTKKYSI